MQSLGSSLRGAAGAHFVLQMPDELIYEVARKDIMEVAQILKTSMEEAAGTRLGLTFSYDS